MLYYPTGAEAGAIDSYTINSIGIPGMVLMERASLAMTDVLEDIITGNENYGRDLSEKDIHRKGRATKILVIAESGNNGGDGVALARMLHERGYMAHVLSLNGLKKRSDSFMQQLRIAEAVGVKIFGGNLDIEDYDVIVDAIFGVGLGREVEGVHKDAIDIMNIADAIKIAVDIPSGINSVNGSVMGNAFIADYTVTFGFTKLGMLFGKGREYSGTIITKDIGFPKAAIKACEPVAFTYEDADIKNLMPVRKPSSNKGTYGKCLIIAGSSDISGAAYLSAAAAYKMGAGLVRIITHKNNRRILSEMLPEALITTYDDVPYVTEDAEESGKPKSDLIADFEKMAKDAINWATGIVIGPGLGTGEIAQELLKMVITNAKCPVIMDADAINIVSRDKSIIEKSKTRPEIIITPHVMEMSRFTGVGVESIKTDPITVAKNTADKYNIAVVLKDARTVVATGSDRIYVNTTGNSAMSKGGSGDVLSGVIGALVAEGLSPKRAARVGTFIHGRAGDKARDNLGEYSVMARDLIDHLI